MKKTAVKNFAIWARRKLISEIKYKAGIMGINENEILEPLAISTNSIQFFDIGTSKPTEISDYEIKQRNALVDKIKEKESTSDYMTAFEFVIEEVAYTWFNRLIAIRFMEVNEYLPSRVRVLSSETEGKKEPDMVTNPFDTDMDFSAYESDRIVQLKDENKLDQLFRMLVIKQCNKLNEILPKLFEKTTDYTELLLNISFTDEDGIVRHLIKDIEEEDFKEAVEIIGWMYQYYNEERKNEVINIYKGTVKKEDIPAATQLFTTDWVVRYMVDNSLGRYWVERNPGSKLQDELQYFVTPKSEKMQYINEKINPEELTFFDPCMGSGHILVYAFDLLMEIYRECGYMDKDATQAIINNNLFGLDIDKRAYQLSYFAVMMKARSYDRRFLTRGIQPNVYEIVETNLIKQFYCEEITKDKELNEIGEYLIHSYKHAKEIGSLLSVKNNSYDKFDKYLDSCNSLDQITMESDYWYREVMPVMKNTLKQAEIMTKKYSVVATNPPYMNKLEGNLKKFVTKEYKAYGSDLFSVFMYRNFDYCKPDGYSAFMTPFVWMFIKTYEQLRKYIIEQKSLTTLIQMEYSAFEEATVPICTFVLKNGNEINNGLYIELTSFNGGMQIQKKKVLQAINDNSCDYFYEVSKENFSKIPGAPIAYIANEEVLKMYRTSKTIADMANVKKGLATGNVDLFVKYWYEVDYSNISFGRENKKWYPCHKGGGYRKWYGNFEKIINWENNGAEIMNYRDESGKLKSRPQNLNYMFCEGIVFSKITSGGSSCRIMTGNEMFDDAVQGIFVDNNDQMLELLGILNSKVVAYFLEFLNPTLNKQIYDLKRIVLLNNEVKYTDIIKRLIQNSKEDWNDYEISWDFKGNVMTQLNVSQLSEAYKHWEKYKLEQFRIAKYGEQKLNEILIEKYSLQEKLTPFLEDSQVTIKKANFKNDVIDMISYAVGCMFGRYSIDIEGLVYAGGEWDDSKYKTYIPNKYNCILITDEEYFEDDIVGLFVEFIMKVYGTKTLEENLEFIAKALGNKGDSPRNIIRNYFIKDFYKDHVEIYKKRPIYWLYDSGKKNGFKTLVYMHRYSADTTGIVRVDYLHKLQKIYISEIDRMQDMIDNSSNVRESAQAEKRKEKLIKQLKETKEYDEKIAHIALNRIDIDLDDGVKVNYEKVQTAQDGKVLNILAKI